jgi:hypothetical protein
MPHSPREVHPPHGTGLHGAPQPPRRPACRGVRPLSARRYGGRPRAPPNRPLLQVPRGAPALFGPLLEFRLRAHFLRPLGRCHPRRFPGRRRAALPHQRPGRRTHPPRRLGRLPARHLAYRSLPLVRPLGALRPLYQNMALRRLRPAGEERLPSRSPPPPPPRRGLPRLPLSGRRLPKPLPGPPRHHLRPPRHRPHPHPGPRRCRQRQNRTLLPHRARLCS